MNDKNLLQKLLETEQQAKMLVQEAQDRADERLHEASSVGQSKFQSEREKRLTALDKEFSEYVGILEKNRESELQSYEESLRKEPVFLEDAVKAIRETLPR